MNYNPFNRKPGIGEDWKLVDQFNSAYWSGQDVKVYFNDILLEDAIQCNYQIVEQVRPYYGYASYVPQRMHHGTRIIAGEFSMNFKRDGYIFSLIQYLTKVSPERFSAAPPQAQATDTVVGRQPAPFSTLLNETLAGDIDNMTAEQLSELAKSIKANRSQRRDFSNESPGVFEPIVRTDKGLFETTRGGFNITIIYGADLSQGKALKFDSSGDFYKDGKTSEPVYEEGSKAQKINCTGIKLVGCSIMSQAKSINDSGQPFIETYSFQARDVQVMSFREIQGLTTRTALDTYNATEMLTFPSDGTSVDGNLVAVGSLIPIT